MVIVSDKVLGIISQLVISCICDCLQALQSGLYSLDMMESVVARISEIANSRSKEGK